jgi:hypothetical protein
MRYHLESTLPIHAFNPLGGRHNPFRHGMTLEGGGGGGIIGGIGDAIGGIAEGVGDALAGVDKAVGDTVPGGWGTIAAIAVPYAAPMITGAALTAGQAAALAAGTRAATGAIRGEDTEDILKGAATAGLTSYGLNSLFGDAGYVPDEGSPYIDGTPPPARDFDYIPDAPRDFDYVPDAPVRDFDTTDIPSSDVPSRDFDTTETPSRDFDVGTFGEIPPEKFVPRDFDYVSSTSPEVIAASSTPTSLSPEEELRRMYEANINDLGAGTSSYGEANELPSVNEVAKDPFRNPSTNFLESPKDYLADKSLQLQFKAEDALDYLQNAPENAYKYLRDTPIKEMGSDLYDFAGRNKLELGLGALSLSSMGGQQPQPQPSPAGYYSGYSPYTGGYGSSGGVADPYLLRNQINAANIYNYRNPYTSRYAQGGEVKHFAFGGISNALTRFTQPIEKAIVQPVGQALPFLKDVAPYAGILAAPFITNPAMAVGVGALSSGFGRPGTGFDMKRALMGGIAAYGASTLGAGVEAAGTEPTKPLVDTLAESYAVPGTEVPVSTVTPKGFFRDTDAMQRGVGNLLSSDSDAATKAFGTKASIFKSGVPIVMGTSGMMAIDEANKMREEAELAAGPARQSQADMLARISKGKKRAEEAVRENPYMYAMGGQVDDELGGDYSAMGMDQGNLQKGLFGLGYAEGGVAKKPISYKNIDIKDELNMPTGKSAQELEGSLPIDNAYLIARLRSMRGIPNEGIVEQGIGANIPIGDSRLNAMVNQDRMMNRRYELGGNTPFLGGELSGMMSKTEGRDPMFNIGYKKRFVEGGMPRFLSGGGDGMSDSIKANIEGTQEARLADGEFVIPADVVSHLGNGSSKAGAKQLYSMMDRVRKARTGNEKQGRQIKPNKMMPA